MSLVHEYMKLHITNDTFYIESADQGPSELLCIDRVTGDVELKTNMEQIPPTVAESKLIYGIFGIIKLLSGPHLIVITGRSRVGVLMGHTVWKIAATEVLPYKKTTLHLKETQLSDNGMYTSLLKDTLKTPSFYFCTSFDLTHTMQRLANADEDFHREPLITRADHRFVWNSHALKDFTYRPELSSFCVPILHGFIQLRSSFINGRTFDFALISRRSCQRAGTRYFVRGIDDQGDVANYVETEQIIMYAGNVCSFVQTRGSIPLHWSQRPNLRYKPKPELMSSKGEDTTSLQRHLDSQVITYGKMMVINLVDQKGSELLLEEAYRNSIDEIKSEHVQYLAFDFHKECSKMRWHRLSILLDKIGLEQENYGYFMQQRDNKVIMKQIGVFRTNCIDCLDRTNVVQSIIARRSVRHQLVQLGVLTSDQLIENEVEFEKMFKNVWADNADACAKQYAGTGALKTDFTRTGKRTKAGLLQDGINSGIRYVKNNFMDGYRQDGIDLLLGNYVVCEEAASPFAVQRHWRHTVGGLVLFIAFSMMLISLIIPAKGILEQFTYVAFWGAATLATASYVIKNGVEFVNQPKLFHTKEKAD